MQNLRALPASVGNQGPLAAASEENLVLTFRKPKRVVLTYLNIVFSFLFKLCLFIESVGEVTANKTNQNMVFGNKTVEIEHSLFSE